MRKATDTYSIFLLRTDGEDVAPTFPMRELPTPGLMFEIDERRWRVREVAVMVAGLTAGDNPVQVECTVVEAARIDPDGNDWIPVGDPD